MWAHSWLVFTMYRTVAHIQECQTATPTRIAGCKVTTQPHQKIGTRSQLGQFPGSQGGGFPGGITRGGALSSAHPYLKCVVPLLFLPILQITELVIIATTPSCGALDE